MGSETLGVKETELTLFVSKLVATVSMTDKKLHREERKIIFILFLKLTQIEDED